MEIADRPAVGHEVALEAPFPAQDLLQGMAAAAGLAVGAVVGAHHGLHPRVHQRVEGGQVGLGHVLPAGHGVEVVAQRLRAGVHREVLGAGGGLHRFALALQALHIARAQPAGQQRVLAIGLVAPAPAGVAEDVHVRGPEGQALVDVPVAVLRRGVVLRAALGGGDVAQPLHQRRVKAGGDADGLGKGRGRAGAGHAVQRFVPPVVGRNAQPVDGRRVIAQLAGGLLHGHAGHQRLRLCSCLIAIHRRVLPTYSNQYTNTIPERLAPVKAADARLLP